MKRNASFLLFLFILILCICSDFYDSGVVNLWSLRYMSEVQNTVSPNEISHFVPETHPRSRHWRAIWAIDNGNAQTALAILKVTIVEGDQYALQLSALAYEQLEDFSAATLIWKQARNVPALHRVAISANQKDRLYDAFQAYYAAWQVDPNKGTLPLVDFYRRAGDYPTAEGVLRQALVSLPISKYRSIWFSRLGGVLIKQNLWLEAVDVNQEGIAENPKNWELYLNLGRSYYEAGYAVDVAVAEFRKALDTDSIIEKALLDIGQFLMVGQMYEIIGDKANAINSYQRALSLDSNNKFASQRLNRLTNDG